MRTTPGSPARTVAPIWHVRRITLGAGGEAEGETFACSGDRSGRIFAGDDQDERERAAPRRVVDLVVRCGTRG